MEGKTGVVKDAIYLEHKTSEYHPESHVRLEVMYEMLNESDVADRFALVVPRPCTAEDLERVHEKRYIDLVASTAGRPAVSLDPDTQTSPRSYEAALHAAGGCLEAVDRIIRGDLRNAYALVRPPGHHAEAARAMGFCLFNNVAVAARYIQAKYGLSRVMIIDWDLHHGNGTQHSFYDDATVLYASSHQYPYYPGTGGFGEIGRGSGEGYTVNFPLSVGHGDSEYVGLFRRAFAQIGRAFKPQFVIVSAGFDIYKGDPLGGMGVTPHGFALLTRILMEMADDTCGGKLLVALEGGYNLEGLRTAGKAVLRELMGDSEVGDEPMEVEKAGCPRVDALIQRFHDAHGDRWKGVII